MISWLAIVGLTIIVGFIGGIQGGRRLAGDWKSPEEQVFNSHPLLAWIHALAAVAGLVAIVEACLASGWQQLALWCVAAWLCPVLMLLVYRITYSQISYTSFPQWPDVRGWLAWPVKIAAALLMWICALCSRDGWELIRDEFSDR